MVRRLHTSKEQTVWNNNQTTNNRHALMLSRLFWRSAQEPVLGTPYCSQRATMQWVLAWQVPSPFSLTISFAICSGKAKNDGDLGGTARHPGRLARIRVGVGRPPAPEGDAQLWDDYWGGLMAMRQARWGDAGDAFGRASKREPADGRSLLARGIRALASDFAGAHDGPAPGTVPQGAGAEVVGVRRRCHQHRDRRPRRADHPQPAKARRADGDVQRHPRAHRRRRGRLHDRVRLGRRLRAGVGVQRRRRGRQADRHPGPQRCAPGSGHWFANRMLATPDLASRGDYSPHAALVRADKLVEGHKLLDLARSAYPFDVDIALASGGHLR